MAPNTRSYQRTRGRITPGWIFILKYFILKAIDLIGQECETEVTMLARYLSVLPKAVRACTSSATKAAASATASLKQQEAADNLEKFLLDLEVLVRPLLQLHRNDFSVSRLVCRGSDAQITSMQFLMR